MGMGMQDGGRDHCRPFLPSQFLPHIPLWSQVPHVPDPPPHTSPHLSPFPLATLADMLEINEQVCF